MNTPDADRRNSWMIFIVVLSIIFTIFWCVGVAPYMLASR